MCRLPRRGNRGEETATCQPSGEIGECPHRFALQMRLSLQSRHITREPLSSSNWWIGRQFCGLSWILASKYSFVSNLRADSQLRLCVTEPNVDKPKKRRFRQGNTFLALPKEGVAKKSRREQRCKISSVRSISLPRNRVTRLSNVGVVA